MIPNRTRFLVFFLLLLSAQAGGAQDRSSLPSAEVDPFGDEPIPSVNPTQESSKQPPTRREAETALEKALELRPIGPGRFAVGPVTGDARARTISIPATARLVTSGEVVEYALVHETGKTHEALFSTTATPEQIHLTCLLLGVKPVGGPGLITPTPESRRQGAVAIEVGWTQDSKPVRHSLSKLVLITPESGAEGSERPMADNPWLYNGSMFSPAGFAAQLDGSIVSLIGDLTALANNIGPDAINDDIHFPNGDLLPETNTEVSVILRFPKKTTDSRKSTPAGRGRPACDVPKRDGSVFFRRGGKCNGLRKAPKERGFLAAGVTPRIAPLPSPSSEGAQEGERFPTRTGKTASCAPSELSEIPFEHPEVNLGAKDLHSFGVLFQSYHISLRPHPADRS